MRFFAALITLSALCVSAVAQDRPTPLSAMPSAAVSVTTGDDPNTLTVRMTLTDAVASRVLSKPVFVIGKGEPGRLVMGSVDAFYEVLLKADPEGRTVDYEAKFVRDGKVEQTQRSILAVMPRT